MTKFIKFLKRLFISNEPPSSSQGPIITLSDLPDCAVLELSEQQQNDKLISDGYASMKNVASKSIYPKDLFKADPKLEHLELPLEIIGGVVIPVAEDEEVLDFNEDYSIELFIFFEDRLKDFIRVDMHTQRQEINEYLSKFEEEKKRHEVHSVLRDLFYSFEYYRIQKNEPINKLPLGVDPTNLLSKTWMYENYLKSKMFEDDRELILRYLYCKETLMIANIHAYHPMLQQLILLCSRRNLMLELNEKYSFEINHPYAFKYSRGLVYANHADLFQDEIGFDWMVEKLSSVENFSLSFLSRLTYVLRDEKVLSPKTKNTEFCDFLNQNFQTDLKKLRPDEALISEAGSEVVTTLINELNNFRKAKI